MNQAIVDRREVFALTEDDLAQVSGGYWQFVAGAIVGAIISDAVGNFIDGASDAISDNATAPEAGGV